MCFASISFGGSPLFFGYVAAFNHGRYFAVPFAFLIFYQCSVFHVKLSFRFVVKTTQTAVLLFFASVISFRPSLFHVKQFRLVFTELGFF